MNLLIKTLKSGYTPAGRLLNKHAMLRQVTAKHLASCLASVAVRLNKITITKLKTN